MWGLAYLKTLRQQEVDNREHVEAERKKQFERCEVRLGNLVKLKTSPENADGSLLSDEEYQNQRSMVLKEKAALAADLDSFEGQLKTKCQTIEKALDLAESVPDAVLSDDMERKREILAALGSNHVVSDKSLAIRPEFPFIELPDCGNQGPCKSPPIEPDNTQKPPGQNGEFVQSSPRLEPKAGIEPATPALRKRCSTN